MLAQISAREEGHVATMHYLNPAQVEDVYQERAYTVIHLASGRRLHSSMPLQTVLLALAGKERDEQS